MANGVFKLRNLAKKWGKKPHKRQRREWWLVKATAKNSKVRRIDPETGSVTIIDPREVLIAREELRKSRRARAKHKPKTANTPKQSGPLPWDD